LSGSSLVSSLVVDGAFNVPSVRLVPELGFHLVYVDHSAIRIACYCSVLCSQFSVPLKPCSSESGVSDEYAFLDIHNNFEGHAKRDEVDVCYFCNKVTCAVFKVDGVVGVWAEFPCLVCPVPCVVGCGLLC